VNELDVLYNRLKSIGIHLKFVNNYPWIYLVSVCNRPVRQKFQSEHGFVIALQYHNGSVKLTDVEKIFKIIRKTVA